jgi:HD-GYP domain-containing protein (c-di-GMP phosphodiesterase class II)
MLHKPVPLTSEEVAILRRHPVGSAELLAPVELPWDVTAIIRRHQERLDGSGYPFALQGDQRSVEVRIIGIVDYYDSRDATSADLESSRRWRG